MTTTHVLDTALGKPARGVPIRLEVADGDAWLVVGVGVTDEDGRLRTLTTAPPPPGTYRIRFDVGAYFAATGQSAFYPSVEVTFLVRDGDHHHVPLLLSPFGSSTYRGS